MDDWGYGLVQNARNARDNAAKVSRYSNGGADMAARWNSFAASLESRVGVIDPVARAAIDAEIRATFADYGAQTNAIIMAGIAADSARVIAAQPVAVQPALIAIQAQVLGQNVPQYVEAATAALGAGATASTVVPATVQGAPMTIQAIAQNVNAAAAVLQSADTIGDAAVAVAVAKPARVDVHAAAAVLQSADTIGDAAVAVAKPARVEAPVVTPQATTPASAPAPALGWVSVAALLAAVAL